MPLSDERSDLSDLVEQVSDALTRTGRSLVTAESCTGGLIAKLMTDRAGSSTIFDRGFVTYSNDSKIELLDVSPETLATYGAVSAQTAEEMARGALKNSNATLAVSITGIAGPDGGSAQKPVGLVYIGIADAGHIAAKECHFSGSRAEIRIQSAATALSLILSHISL
ncbi:MAG: CinA family protein [Rhodospirillales bacterium]|nr:CinA family protein [Rhodospirillales bacterium]MCB9965026.1 CinA family protein [Rhodospirillales bacterium]